MAKERKKNLSKSSEQKKNFFFGKKCQSSYQQCEHDG
jgi:hypothetical protein